MNGIHNYNTHNIEKPIPGCLGRMVDLFDLSIGIPGNKLLTDGPQRDGCPLSRSCSSVSGMKAVGDNIEDKAITSELRRTSSSKKLNGTPIKMLMAQEMSKEVESKRKPPNVVAKLMGLDTLPQQQPDLASRRCHSRSFSESHLGKPLGYWQQEHEFLDTQEQQEVHQFREQNDCKDVYEIWQSHNNYVRDKSSNRARFEESTTEKKMALVRQKFTDLKCLATDEKLRQSKQFQDALEVLSSNKDLFLKFLQEPNSMFSQQLYDLQSISPPSGKRRITVLRPAKMVDSNKLARTGKQFEKQINSGSNIDQFNEWGKSNSGFTHPSSFKVEDNRMQATRIVVLRPTHGKSDGTKAVASPLSSSARALNAKYSYRDPQDDDIQESREVANEITRQMLENLRGHRRDETMLSSVFSNGYNGDESSCDKSEDEYAAENLSDSEVLSTTSRHSWDYINKFGGPYSFSSFSHASYSPESSVCREAKKRLSERWAIMASSGSCQDKRPVQRNSSTLGEMLAISDVKKSPKPEKEGRNKAQEYRVSTTSCLIGDSDDKDTCYATPRNFSRSKSLPASYTADGSRLDLEARDPKIEKTNLGKEVTRSRSVKSSFKGRVSSLFFSKNKKSIKEKSSESKEEIESSRMPRCFPASEDDSEIRCQVEILPDDRNISPSKASSLDLLSMAQKQGMIPTKAEFHETKAFRNADPNQNEEQPSPISVLEPPFEEDEHTSPEFSTNLKPEGNGILPPLHPIKSNLIDKSPPIGSIARTLSWDDSCTETTLPFSVKSCAPPMGAEEEKQEWVFFVRTLLSAAGLNSDVQSDTVLPRWHSLESPLDPSLRDNYVDLNDKTMLHEAKRRQKRSTRNLVFDCVNAVLVNITKSRSATCHRSILWHGPHAEFQDHTSSTVEDRVWSQMKEWFYGEVKYVFDDYEDNNSLLLERLVRKEVVGNGWDENLRTEIDNYQNEIGGTLLEELVQEAIEEFAGGFW